MAVLARGIRDPKFPEFCGGLAPSPAPLSPCKAYRLVALACDKVQLRRQIAPAPVVLAGSLVQVRHRSPASRHTVETVPDGAAVSEGDLKSLRRSKLGGADPAGLPLPRISPRG